MPKSQFAVTKPKSQQEIKTFIAKLRSDANRAPNRATRDYLNHTARDLEQAEIIHNQKTK